MPIRNCPISSLYGNNTLTLPVKIINPHTGLAIRTNGLIDTGATECAIPARMAVMLGHNLTRGIRNSINTGNGISETYQHTSTILIYHPENPDAQIIYYLDNVLIDCMPNLKIVLLGVNGFLSNFRLDIDYPNGRFSLIR